MLSSPPEGRRAQKGPSQSITVLLLTSETMKGKFGFQLQVEDLVWIYRGETENGSGVAELI